MKSSKKNFKKLLKYFCKAFYRGENSINSVSKIDNKSIEVVISSNDLPLIYEVNTDGSFDLSIGDKSTYGGISFDELTENFNQNTHVSFDLSIDDIPFFEGISLDELTENFKQNTHVGDDGFAVKANNKLFKLATKLALNESFNYFSNDIDTELGLYSIHFKSIVSRVEFQIEYCPIDKLYIVYYQIPTFIDGFKYDRKHLNTFRKLKELVDYFNTTNVDILKSTFIHYINLDDFAIILSKIKESENSLITDIKRNELLDGTEILIENNDDEKLNITVYDNKKGVICLKNYYGLDNDKTFFNFDELLKFIEPYILKKWR